MIDLKIHKTISVIETQILHKKLFKSIIKPDLPLIFIISR